MVLSGAAVVTPAGVLDPATIVIEHGVIVEVRAGARPADRGYEGHLIVPGFVDVHVHGVDGVDSLATPDGVEQMAARLPRYGVTAFCPTTVACAPGDLKRVLAAAARMRADRPGRGARVAGAHLESNFINAEYRGAQPADCLRSPLDANPPAAAGFTASGILDEIDRAGRSVAIVTLAPELDGGLDLVRRLAGAGLRVSLGHSAASYEQGIAAIEAGARHATHLFNRMPSFSHRAPGLVGAILDRAEVSAELIVDGCHVHPAMLRAALRALGPDRAIAITDGTAVSGLPAGTAAHLGSARLTAGPRVALLDDGTWAGSVLTMDAAFRNLATTFGCGVVEAARLCAANPARALGLADSGRIAAGAAADLVVLDADLRVAQTVIGGTTVFQRS